MIIFPGGSEGKHLPAMQETLLPFLGQEDLLEKEMATHSSTLAWKIPWMKKPGRLQSMGLQRVGHAFELWCWRRLLRVPWTARRSNQSILKKISPGISLEGMIPLEKEMSTHSSILTWRIPGQKSLQGYSPRSQKETHLSHFHLSF